MKSKQSIVSFLFLSFFFCYFQSMASYSISLNLTNLIVIWSQNKYKLAPTMTYSGETERTRKNDTFTKQSFDTFNGTISKVIENWCDANFLHLNEISRVEKSVSKLHTLGHSDTQWTIFICQLHLFDAQTVKSINNVLGECRKKCTRINCVESAQKFNSIRSVCYTRYRHC